ncbi:hypothetical protein BSKO_02814 [Bryopsis sp. KO-2023]|nr:hypothetical protein BSKO_02814 [Bryopsis sp. KO-2023]
MLQAIKILANAKVSNKFFEMASRTQSRGRALEENELCNPQDGHAEGSTLEDDDVCEAIRLLKVTNDEKEKQLHDVLKQVEEMKKALSAKDATIDLRDAFISNALSMAQTQVATTPENQSLVDFLREEIREVQGQLKEKSAQITALEKELNERDDIILTFQTTLEENVAERVAREDEIEAVQANFEKKLTGKDEKITALEENIRERDEMMKSHEIKWRDAIQEKSNEIKALKIEFDDIRKIVASHVKTKETSAGLLLDANEDGNLLKVKALIFMGLDVNTQDEHSREMTPLHRAAGFGHLSIVGTLLSAGAVVDKKCNIGGTPLHVASLSGHPTVVKALLHAGAYVDAQTNQGETALHVASMCGHLDTARELINHDARKDICDDNGRTAAEVISACNGNNARKKELEDLLKKD